MSDDGLGPAGAEEEVAADLLRRERQGERAALEIGPWTAYMLVAGMQAAARFLPPQDFRVKALREVSQQVEPLLGVDTAAAAMVEAGWRQLGDP